MMTSTWLLAASLALAAPPAAAQSLTTLFSFQGSAGANPYAPLFSRGGFLYGTTNSGGSGGGGTVVRIDARTGAPTTLHSFTGAPDGAIPFAGLIYHDGTLYGTTAAGGTSNFGTVFAIDPSTGDETVLHAFSGPDGETPFGGLIYQGALLYGTTLQGGTSGHGTVFTVDPKSRSEKVLYSFAGGTDGAEPAASLLYLHGALFGTTAFGGGTGCGHTGCGTIFKVDPATGAESVLHTFGGAGDGTNPEAPLIVHDGTLYGTATSGGASRQGAVFAFNPKTGDESVLYSFAGAPDGAAPYGAVIVHHGLLYGTTAGGGATHSGTIFAIDPATGAETVRYSLAAHTDGKTPEAALIARGGALYGTTLNGGADGNGTAFKFSP